MGELTGDWRRDEDVEHELRYYMSLVVECVDQAKCDQVKAALNTKVGQILPDGAVGEKVLKRIVKSVTEEEGDAGVVTLTITARIGWRTGLKAFNHTTALAKRAELVQWMTDANKTGINSAVFKGHLCPHASTVPLGRCTSTTLYEYP